MCVRVLKYLETNLDYPMNKRDSLVIVYDTLLETKISPSEPTLLRDFPRICGFPAEYLPNNPIGSMAGIPLYLILYYKKSTSQ